ncbi:MAG: type I-MYXAN CRISPR-associated protein Cas6/Cmx6 [Burkholderiales bacterium]|nr:type I-MYXAN CRISPR-associated protein Cas6/Cmx6 [Burkholderiales bacterium]
MDVSFALAGRELLRDHGLALAQALCGILPWLHDVPQAAVLPVNLVQGAGELALLSRRARLVLRVPRERVAALAPLLGLGLTIGEDLISLAGPKVRELLPHSTLHAAFVDAEGAVEADFLEAVGAQLEWLGVRCQRVCGRARRVRGPGRALSGFSLMLHGLQPRDSLRVLEQGLGGNRLLGCGVFVGHKTAAAVGE